MALRTAPRKAVGSTCTTRKATRLVTNLAGLGESHCCHSIGTITNFYLDMTTTFYLGMTASLDPDCFYYTYCLRISKLPYWRYTPTRSAHPTPD